MQMKTRTDYAIRILLHLSRDRAIVVGKELSQTLGIAETYLPKIIQQLRQAGWVESTCGVHGGFRLLARPGEITLLDVMRVMERSVYVSRCLEKDRSCGGDVEENCPVHRIYLDFQHITEWYFSAITLADLVGGADKDPIGDWRGRLKPDIKQMFYEEQSDERRIEDGRRGTEDIEKNMTKSEGG